MKNKMNLHKIWYKLSPIIKTSNEKRMAKIPLHYLTLKKLVDLVRHFPLFPHPLPPTLGQYD